MKLFTLATRIIFRKRLQLNSFSNNVPITETKYTNWFLHNGNIGLNTAHNQTNDQYQKSTPLHLFKVNSKVNWRIPFDLVQVFTLLLLDSCNMSEKLCAYFFLEKDNYSGDEQSNWSSQNTDFDDEDVNKCSPSNKKNKNRKSEKWFPKGDFACDTV